MAHEGTAKLRDGRALGYAEYGDPGGKPILEFHGLPGSRFYRLDQDALVQSGARLLSVERPGIGLSDPSPDRALTDWPLDVADLADQLDLGRFAVLGTSAGAAYALATGLGLPERVTGVGLMCALGPAFDNQEFDSSLAAAVQALMPLARQDREATIPLVHQFLDAERKKWQADPDAFFEEVAAGWPANDRAAYQDAADIWRMNLDATYRQEGAYATDIILVFGPWQLDLSAMHVPVRAWHGTDDASAPLGLAQKVIDATGGELVKLPGQGHYLNATVHGEIVQWLVDPRT
jgi:pimeloyl-ACP methyl ester carboxylesterase